MALLALPASAQTVTPGNPRCADLDSDFVEFKIEPMANGVFTDGTIVVTIANFNGTHFDFVASEGVHAVIVKGGPNANVYTYDPPTNADTGLRAPINPNNNRPFSISQASFCYIVTTNGNGPGPECPTNLEAQARSDTTILLTWDAATDADSYNVYRAVGAGPFVLLGNTTGTSFVDSDTVVGVTYRYTVTTVIGDEESEDCDEVEATAIPFFTSPWAAAIATLGATGAWVALRRRS